MVLSVWRAATLARGCTLAFMIAFDLIVDDYDTSGSLSPGPGPRDPSSSALCRRAEGLVTWDSVYFARVATNGYEYEQTHAFFPLLPWLMRALSPLFGGGSCGVAVSGLAVSNAAHVASAVALERLGTSILDDEVLARAAAMLYAFNPAAVFHSAIYTEPLFAFLSFTGCLLLARTRKNAACVAFALASLARSNGVLNLIHLAFDFWRFALTPALRQMRRLWGEEEEGGGDVNGHESAVARVKRRKRVAWAKGLATASFVFLARCVSVLAPTLWFQWMGYRTFCLGGGDPNGYYAANPRPWCASWRPFPNVYAFVQDHYWNVGLFRYYSPKQLPNFLLALPALGASVHAARAYVKGADEDATWMRKEPLRPFMFQWCVMALAAAAVMHVQVATRFLSVSPAVYWYLARVGANEGAGTRKMRRIVSTYCVVFGLVGTLMFPTFYPWT